MSNLEQTVTELKTENTLRMTTSHYNELIDLLHEKIRRLEREKDEQSEEINQLKRELKAAENRRESQTTGG